jgi:hypothetical protein
MNILSEKERKGWSKAIRSILCQRHRSEPLSLELCLPAEALA